MVFCFDNARKLRVVSPKSVGPLPHSENITITEQNGQHPIMNKNPLSKYYWGLILLINCVCWAIGCSSGSEIIPTLQTESTPQIIPIEISSEAMIDPDLPSYLLTVLPWPGETLTLTEYNSLATNHSLVRTTTPSICLWIDPIVEPGDFFETYVDWLQQAELSLMGR